jgi:hypothetical protein
VKKLLFILLVLASCSITNKKHTSRPLHFFACATWVDRNQDGKYDYYEFENIKDTFHSSEKVLFVGFFHDLPAGSNLRFRLYAPDGSLVHEENQIQLFNVALFHPEYSVSDLISERSSGVWEAVWDVEDEVVADIEVKLIY